MRTQGTYVEEIMAKVTAVVERFFEGVRGLPKGNALYVVEHQAFRAGRKIARMLIQRCWICSAVATAGIGGSTRRGTSGNSSSMCGGQSRRWSGRCRRCVSSGADACEPPDWC